MFKAKNSNTRTRCKICSKLTIKTPGDFEKVNAGWVVNSNEVIALKEAINDSNCLLDWKLEW